MASRCLNFTIASERWDILKWCRACLQLLFRFSRNELLFTLQKPLNKQTNPKISLRCHHTYWNKLKKKITYGKCYHSLGSCTEPDILLKSSNWKTVSAGLGLDVWHTIVSFSSVLPKLWTVDPQELQKQGKGSHRILTIHPPLPYIMYTIVALMWSHGQWPRTSKEPPIIYLKMAQCV